MPTRDHPQLLHVIITEFGHFTFILQLSTTIQIHVTNYLIVTIVVTQIHFFSELRHERQHELYIIGIKKDT